LAGLLAADRISWLCAMDAGLALNVPIRPAELQKLKNGLHFVHFNWLAMISPRLQRENTQPVGSLKMAGSQVPIGGRF